MQTTGGSDFLIYGLLFLAIVGFNLFKQFMTARREQIRRQNRQAQNQPEAVAARPEPMQEPESSDFELDETHWGRAEPEPAQLTVATAEPVVQPLEVVLAKEMLEKWREESSAEPTRPPRRQPVPSRSGYGRRLIRNRGELRHAIVLMTVLGPCRALQPYDQDQH